MSDGGGGVKLLKTLTIVPNVYRLKQSKTNGKCTCNPLGPNHTANDFERFNRFSTNAYVQCNFIAFEV